MHGGAERLRLAVLSAKGGCGRSTVAINLAYLLAAAGRRVALVDLAQFGSLAVLLQVLPAPGTGLGPVAACLASAHRNELPEVLDAALAPCRIGAVRAWLLAAAAPQRQDDLRLEGLLDMLQTLSAGGYDLVLDTSHELSDRLAAALHVATHRLWVVSPDPAAGWHVLQALELARQLSAPAVPSGLVLNRHHRRCGLRPADMAAVAGLPLWAVLPDVPGRLPLAAHRSIPLVAHRSGRWQAELRRTLLITGVTPSPRLWWLRRGREVAHDTV